MKKNMEHAMETSCGDANGVWQPKNAVEQHGLYSSYGT